jgi:hypothetical protein
MDVAAVSSVTVNGVAPSVTPTKTGLLLVCGWGSATGFVSASPVTLGLPAGLTQVARHDSTSSDTAFLGGTKDLADDSATGDQTATGLPTDGHHTTIGSQVVLYAWPAPNAPILRLPANNVTVSSSAPLRFSWDFSGALGDTQSGYSFRYRYGTGAWTVLSATGPSTYRDFAAGSLADGTLEWQVQTIGSTGLQGSWSASSFVTLADPPAGPTITDPTNGVTLGSNSHPVQFSYPQLSAYRYQVVDQSSAVVVPLTTVTDPGSRQFTIGGLVDGSTVTISLAVQDASTGLWSADVTSTNPVSYTAPPAPTAAVTVDDVNDLLDVVYTTAPGTGEQPNATSAQVWISLDGGVTSYLHKDAVGLPITGTWTYRTPASGQDYAFKVVVLADNGVTADSGWVGSSNPFGSAAYGTGTYGGTG